MTIIKLDDAFCSLVDELVELSATDEELRKGINWIDEQSKKFNVRFYEMFYLILQKHLAEIKAKEWLKIK